MKQIGCGFPCFSLSWKCGYSFNSTIVICQLKWQEPAPQKSNLCLGKVLSVGKFSRLIQPLCSSLDNDKFFIIQTIQQCIYPPANRACGGLPVLEYVFVNGYVEHRGKLDKQLNAGGLSLVFDGLDVPGNIVDDFREILSRHALGFTGLLDGLSDWREVKFKVVASFFHNLTAVKIEL